jgi:acyl-ACP thioesterase
MIDQEKNYIKVDQEQVPLLYKSGQMADQKSNQDIPYCKIVLYIIAIFSHLNNPAIYWHAWITHFTTSQSTYKT